PPRHPPPPRDPPQAATRGSGRAGSAGTCRRPPPPRPAPRGRPGTAAARGCPGRGGDPTSRRGSLPRWTDMRYSTLPTPIGELVLTAHPARAPTPLHFHTRPPHTPRAHPPSRHPPTGRAHPRGGQRADALLEPVRRQLAEYFAGERTGFD